MENLRTEIAVVGSGPGGAVTAGLLAEAGRQVLLIEEGPNLQPDSAPPFSREEMVQKYRACGISAALGPAKIAYVEGCVVGGGSEINSALYHRLPDEVLEGWVRRLDIKDLSPGDLRPHFEDLEGELGVGLPPPDRPRPQAALKLAGAAKELGLEVYETPRMFDYSPDASGLPGGGRRRSMSRSCLPKFLKAGGEILPLTRAKRLWRSGNRWIIECVRRAPGAKPGSVRIEADTVFLSCGAVQTPALLRRSGIRRNVGDSLGMHPTIKITASFDSDVNGASMGVPAHQARSRDGHFLLGCSVSTPAHLALALAGYPEALRGLENEWRRMAAYYAMASSETTGTVRPWPVFRDPMVRYPATAPDLGILRESLRVLAQALFAAGAKKLYPSIDGLAAWESPADLERLPDPLDASALRLVTLHLFGSCPMGENAARAAVDSFGRVHGLAGLHVADASLMGGSPGVNPQGTILALCRRNALKFLGKI